MTTRSERDDEQNSRNSKPRIKRTRTPKDLEIAMPAKGWKATVEKHPHRHHHNGTAKLRNLDKEKTQQKRPEKKGNGQNTQSTESEHARRSVCEPRHNTRPQQAKKAH